MGAKGIFQAPLSADRVRALLGPSQRLAPERVRELLRRPDEAPPSAETVAVLDLKGRAAKEWLAKLEVGQSFRVPTYGLRNRWLSRAERMGMRLQTKIQPDGWIRMTRVS